MAVPKAGWKRFFLILLVGDTQKVCAIRWKIEQFHRELKQVTGSRNVNTEKCTFKKPYCVRCACLDQVDRTDKDINDNHLPDKGKFTRRILEAGTSKTLGSILLPTKSNRIIFHYAKIQRAFA